MSYAQNQAMLSMLAAGVNGDTVVNPIKRKVIGSQTATTKTPAGVVTTTKAPTSTTPKEDVQTVTGPIKYSTATSPNPATVQTAVIPTGKPETVEPAKKINPLFLIAGGSLLLYYLLFKK